MKARNGFLTIFLIGLLAKTFGAPGYQNLTDPVDCTNEASAISFPNPTDCNKYFQCENGTKTEITCPLGQHYNVFFKTCDDPRYAGCKIKPSLNATVPVGGSTSENPILTTQKWYKVLGLQNSTNSTEKNPASPKEGYKTVAGVSVKSVPASNNNTYNATRSPEVRNNYTLSSQAIAAIDIKKIKAEITADNRTSSSNGAIISDTKSKVPEDGKSKISPEITTTDSSEESIESATTDRGILGKINVTNGNNLKIADKKYGNSDSNETEDKDDETENEGDEEKETGKETNPKKVK